MLYVLLHKGPDGTEIVSISRNMIGATKEFVKCFYETLNAVHSKDIQETSFQSDPPYAEIVVDDETEWWQVMPYKEADIK